MPIMENPAVVVPGTESQQQQQQQQLVKLSEEDAATLHAHFVKGFTAVLDKQRQQLQQLSNMRDAEYDAKVAALERKNAELTLTVAQLKVQAQESDARYRRQLVEAYNSLEQFAKQRAAATDQRTAALIEEIEKLERQTAAIEAQTAQVQELLPAAEAKLIAVIAATVADVAAARSDSDAQTRELRKTLQALFSATEQQQ
jgi:DNA repair exonuclease SbcCD ATPase subunit